MSVRTVKAARTRIRVCRQRLARVDSRLPVPELVMVDWFRRDTVSGVVGR